MSKTLLILILAILICIFPTCGSFSSGYANGGSITSISKECSTSADVMPQFGKVSDYYLQNAKSQTILSLGRTGIQQEGDSTKVETLGMLNAFDRAGLFSTQTNIPEQTCDTGGFLIENNTDSSRYPETQSMEGLWGLMGSGEGTSYESQVVVNGKTIGVSVRGTTPQGYLYEDARGDIKTGFDKNNSLLQYTYSKHEHHLYTSNETKALDAGRDWLWDESADAMVNETDDEPVNNTTGEEDLP